jgi:hypothetical protein
MAAHRQSIRSHFDPSRLADTFETEGHSGAWWLSAAGRLRGGRQTENPRLTCPLLLQLNPEPLCNGPVRSVPTARRVVLKRGAAQMPPF